MNQGHIDSGSSGPKRGWILALTLVVLSAGVGLRDPWHPDEPRYTLLARNMIETGEWFFPPIFGERYAHKPPLFFWAIAGSYHMTGSWRVAFLLPSMLAGLGTLVLVHDLALRLWGRRSARLAALGLLVSYQFVHQARFGQIDASLCFWTTLGLYGLARHLLLGPSMRWYLAAFAAMGIGILTKGVGFLPALLFLPYILVLRRGWSGLAQFPSRWWHWALGPLTMLGVVALWLVPMLVLVARSGDPDLLRYRDTLLFGQTLHRYVSFTKHKRWFGYLFTQALVLWLPLTGLLPWAIPAWVRRLRDRDGPIGLLLGWSLLVLVFFSFGAGKRGVYVLPALPAFVLALAPLLTDLLARRTVDRVARALTVGVGVLALLGAAGFAAGLSDWLAAGGVAALPSGLGWLLLAVGIVAMGCLAAASRRGGSAAGSVALASTLYLVVILVGWIGYPMLNPVRTPHRMLARVDQVVGSEGQVGLIDRREQIPLLAGRRIVTFGYRSVPYDEQLERACVWLRGDGRRWLLVPSRPERLRPFLPCRGIVVGRLYGREWRLFDRTELADPGQSPR